MVTLVLNKIQGSIIEAQDQNQGDHIHPFNTDQETKLNRRLTTI